MKKGFVLIDRNLKAYKLNGNCKPARIDQAEVLLNGSPAEKTILSIINPDRRAIKRYAKAMKNNPTKVKVSVLPKA